MRLKELLNEITERLRGDLPELAASFNPPATEIELRQAEEELGFSLPAELRELYLIHNGESEHGPGLFFGLPFLSLDGMLTEWRIWAELEEEYAWEGEHYSVPAAWIKERYIHRCWLPISKDWGGNHLGIDLDPDEQGRKGQVINFGRDEEVKYVIAHRLTHLLQFIRDTAKERNYTVHEEEDYRFWSYGRDSQIHFLDAIRSLDLPVLEPLRLDSNAPDPLAWFGGLDDKWKARVVAACGSPEACVRAKRLRFIQEGLADIAPLARCTDVRELVLSVNEIRSIEAVSHCTQLKRLYLGKNPVSDLRPLQGLMHLQELFLAGTEVTDLSPLSVLPKLRALDVQQTAIRDWSPLKAVHSLRALEVSRPDGEQLRGLAELEQLAELTLSGLGSIAEDDLAVLGQLVNLRVIQLEEVSLPNLEFLRNCRKLRTVKMTNPAVKDISILADLENLQSLELSGCPDIGKLEEIARSASLKKITASFPQFALLKDRFGRKIDFSTMTGSMTDEEEEIWYEYVRA